MCTISAIYFPSTVKSKMLALPLKEDYTTQKGNGKDGGMTYKSLENKFL